MPPIIIPQQEASLNPITHDKIQSLITPPASPSSTPPPSIIVTPKELFTPKLLLEIILENLLGQPKRYKLYLNDIKQYFENMKAVYIIDSENLRYKFLDQLRQKSGTYYKKDINGYPIEVTQLEREQSWPAMYDYLSQFMSGDKMILLCANRDNAYKKLLEYKKLKPGLLYSNIFTLNFKALNFKASNPVYEFTPSDDLLFWLYAMAIRKILPESCTFYQNIESNQTNPNCMLHLITADKQKLYDLNPHTHKLKNFYAEFKMFEDQHEITFYINNSINSVISDLIKLFLLKFINKVHDPTAYVNDIFGLNLIKKCDTGKTKCDFFEKFVSNVKILQKQYFPKCDETCVCQAGKSCKGCTCAIDGSLMTKFK